MLRSRIIPCLLIQNGGLVKTKNFKDPKYVGDPLNAVRIFNEKCVDELAVFDIDATVKGKEPNYKLIEKLAAECRMPMCYGGGIYSASIARRLINMGLEKVAISSSAVIDHNILSDIASSIGRQSVVGVLDVKTKNNLFSTTYSVCTHNAKSNYSYNPFELVKTFERAGSGEIFINDVENDGLMNGYNLDLASKMKSIVNIPLTILGGAGTLADIKSLTDSVGLVGAAAGSIFVFKGKYRAVLLSYPNLEEKDKISYISGY